MRCKSCTHDLSIIVSEKSPLKVEVNSDKTSALFATFECRNANLIKWIYEEGITVVS